MAWKALIICLNMFFESILIFCLILYWRKKYFLWNCSYFERILRSYWCLFWATNDTCSISVIAEIKCNLEDNASRITGSFVGIFSLPLGQLIISHWNCTCLWHSQLGVRYSVSLHINWTAVNLWRTYISRLENEGILAWSTHPKTKGRWFDKAVLSVQLRSFQDETKHMYDFPRHKPLCLQLQTKFKYSWCACFHIQSPIYLYHMSFAHN